MSSPHAIFFDLDETLVENRIPVPTLFAQMYFQFEEALGTGNQDAFFSALRPNAAKLWASMFDTEVSPEDQFVELFSGAIASLQRLDAAATADLAQAMFRRYQEMSSGNVVLHDGAVETLAALRDAGFITGIITNGIEQIQLGKINTLGLEQQVDHVVVSAQARAHKPSLKVFQLALERADVSADKAWQIGDHATNDVAGAIRAGMSGVFFDPARDRSDHAFTELAESPTHIIHHLAEVPALANA